MPDEVIQQVPALALMVIMLLAFLKHLEKVNTRHELISQHCHQVQREATEAIRDCAEVIGKNNEVLRESLVLLRNMNGKDHKA